ncbi:MAG: hypothetical protein ACREMZ_03115 [Gemmatimonadales bacterium]
MSNPFSGIPDPGMPRPIRRRAQPRMVEEALRAIQDALRAALPVAQGALGRAQRAAKDASRRARRYGEDLWRRGKRKPRTSGLIGGAIALTLVGGYALSASEAGRSVCPPPSDPKTPQFLLLMDPVLHLEAGSKVKIHYDVCGLPSGTPYLGRVRLAQQRPAGKKKSARPKPLVVSFKDQVDGVATRRHQQLDLASTKPGTYTLELSVADNRERERKRVQKVLVKTR